MAREVLGVAGAVIGGIYGGPQGAQIGFIVGSTIGGLIDGPETQKAPDLADAPIQTSRDGVPIPIIWGLHHCHGNIIAKCPEVIITTTESQGKGGGTEVETKHRYRTFAIGVCTSPIGVVESISRIWENDKLVYDINGYGGLPAAETTAYAENITIYTGAESQLPDPELETHYGVGDTPAFRGLCYIVWNNYDLTNFGGAIPQYRFEVNTHPDMVGTSHVYALEFTDGLTNDAQTIKGTLLQVVEDGLTNTAAPQNGLLGAVLETYEMEDEGLTNTATPQYGLLGDVLVTYDRTEDGLTNTATPQNGLLGAVLVTYICPDEGLTNTATPQNGTLT